MDDASADRETALDRVVPREQYQSGTSGRRGGIARPRDASGCPHCGCTRLRSMSGDRRQCDRCKIVSAARDADELVFFRRCWTLAAMRIPPKTIIQYCTDRRYDRSDAVFFSG